MDTKICRITNLRKEKQYIEKRRIMKLLDPELVRFFSRCRLLCWKALLMRRNSLLITFLEIIVPIILIIQIRLIFNPLAFESRKEEFSKKDILNSYPEHAKCWYSPSNTFTEELMSKASQLLKISVFPESNEKQLITKHFLKNGTSNIFWVIFQTTTIKHLEYTIRSSEMGKSRMIVLKEEEPMGVDPYLSSGFTALQLAIEDSFFKMWKKPQSPEIQMTIGRFPFYKINFLFVPSSIISIIYYITIMAFILLPISTLSKLIHDKETGFRDLLRISGINDSFHYFGGLTYLSIIGIPVTIVCTFILYPIYSSNSNALEIGIFLFFHMVVTSVCMFAIGSFFISTTKAVLICTLCWLLMARITNELDEYFDDSPLGIKILSLALPHSGLLYGIAALTYKTEEFPESIDNYEKGLSENFQKVEHDNEIFPKKNTVSLVMVLFTWFLHIIFWTCISIYFDNISPGKFGSRNSLFYLCKKKPPSIKATNVTHKGTTNWYAVESVPQYLKPMIRVRNITKKFGRIGNRTLAVDNMTINFYENEFSVILGHNGAGKSTLLRLLVGIYKPLNGNIYIEEDRKIKSVYSQIGFCPQENILVNYLTVLQHLYLFGMVKGLSYKDSLKESRQLVKKLNLEKDQNSKITHLCSGIQRRVSVALSLIGDNRILVLDEPTYGIDPLNGKLVWKLLSEVKRKMTVVMATNSMEVIDILADRIAIFVNGKVQFFGSKAYLNRHCGMGFILRIIFCEECDLNLLQQEIQTFSAVPITQRDIMGRVVKYNVPKRSQIALLVEYLQFHKERLKIISTSIYAVEIEDQFLKMGLVNQFRERGAYFSGPNYEQMFQRRRRDLIRSGEKWKRVSGLKLLMQQIYAMLYKKILHFASSWKFHLFCIIFALLTIAMTMAVSQLGQTEFFQTKEVYLNISNYKNILFYVEKSEKAENLLNSIYTTGQNYKEAKNFQISKKIPASERIINPYFHSIKFSDRYFMSIDIWKTGGIKMMYSSHAIHGGPISINLLYNSLLRQNGCNDCKITLKSFPLVNPRQWQNFSIHLQTVRIWSNAAIMISLLLILPSIDLGMKEKMSISKQIQLNTSGVNTIIYWIPNYFLDLLIYILSLGIMALLCYIFYRRDLVNFTPMAFMEVSKIFLLYGIAAIPLNYCLHLLPFKAGTIFLIVIFMNISVVIIRNISILLPLVHDFVQSFQKIIIEFVLHTIPPYVLGCAIENYIIIFLFDYQCEKLNSCNTDYRFEDPCCYNCDDPENYCFRPYNIMQRKSSDQYYHSVPNDLNALIFQGMFFNFLLQFLEKKNIRKWLRYFDKLVSIFKKKEKITKVVAETIDGRTLDEKKKCAELIKEYEEKRNLEPEVAMVVQNLTKYYRKRMVIQDFNLILKQREYFGLLGMNSSGKSTIFKMLMGKTSITKGDAVIQKYRLRKESEKFLGLISFYPQYGGLNDYLTGKQNLIFFALIRGIPFKNIGQEVEKWLDIFDFLDFENMRLDKCAFGLQRKMCLLQSLIGDLPILCLEEPTSGIDVLAKHVLCEVLNHAGEMGRSLLSSTHSIQDVEAVCSRVGILLEGKLVAVGTLEDLTNTHGNNFTLNINFDQEQSPSSTDGTEVIKQDIIEIIPDAILKDQIFQGQLTFEIPGTISYGIVFVLLQKCMQNNATIHDFSLNHTTLEEVFLKLSSNSENH